MRILLVIYSLLILSTLLQAQADCGCSFFSEEKKQIPDAYILIQSGEPGCRVKGYEIAAKELFIRKELDSAEQYLQQSLAILESQNCGQSSFLTTYKYFANLYNNRADYEKQLDYELKINTVLEMMKDTASVAFSFLNISDVFYRMKQADKGIAYCRKAIPIIMQLGPSSQKASLFTRAAQRYYYYFEQHRDIKYLDSMELYANEALNIMKKTAVDRKVQFLIYTRLITVAIERKDYNTALEYIDNNLALCERDKDIPELAVNFSDKAEVYLNMGHYAAAKKWADSSMVYTKLTQSPTHIANVYTLIYKIADKMGDTKDALNAYRNERTITDSLTNADKTKAITELEKKYNQAKNEKTIKELAQQKQIYLLLAVTGLLGLVAIAFWIRQQSLKHKQKILETEQRLNRARMNPHFFFNALATLHSFAVREKDADAIASNLSKFSHIMRETLESTYKEYVTVEQEIDFLNEYLDVQQIHFHKKFIYAVTAEKDLETDEIIIPSMIIQPFVENSIEHGFGEIDYTGDIKVVFTKSNKELQILITDNGTGLITDRKQNNEHISRANQIIKDRIYLLNVKLKTKASFSIDNISGSNGVLVKINLPLLYINNI